PRGLRRSQAGGHFDRPTRGELRRLAGADVLIPDYFSPDAVGHDVRQAVSIPIGHAENRVAPLGLGGALDRSIWSGLLPDELAAGAQIARRRPADWVSPEILDEGNV